MKDHKRLYGVYIRSSMLAAIIITIMAFSFVPDIEVKPYTQAVKLEDIIKLDYFIPTDKEPEPKLPEKKPLPQVAVPGDNNKDNVITIDGEADFDDLIPGGIGRLEKPIKYYEATIRPKPLNTPPPKYPEILRKAGIEGDCVLWGIIDTTGRIVQARVYHPADNPLFDEAALSAFKNYQFSPGYQRDRLVPVEIIMPFKFRLK